MPQVHITGIRFPVRQAAVTDALQRYAELGWVEARRSAERIMAGDRPSFHLDDFEIAYELALHLTEIGVDAEADDGDYGGPLERR